MESSLTNAFSNEYQLKYDYPVPNEVSDSHGSKVKAVHSLTNNFHSQFFHFPLDQPRECPLRIPSNLTKKYSKNKINQKGLDLLFIDEIIVTEASSEYDDFDDPSVFTFSFQTSLGEVKIKIFKLFSSGFGRKRFKDSDDVKDFMKFHKEISSESQLTAIIFLIRLFEERPYYFQNSFFEKHIKLVVGQDCFFSNTEIVFKEPFKILNYLFRKNPYLFNFYIQT